MTHRHYEVKDRGRRVSRSLRPLAKCGPESEKPFTEIDWGRKYRRHLGSPATMRATAAMLRNPDPAELALLGVTPNALWIEGAARLERLADYFEGQARG